MWIVDVGDKAKALLPKILKEIEAEGLMNWEVEWLAQEISDADKRSGREAIFTLSSCPLVRNYNAKRGQAVQESDKSEERTEEDSDG